MARRLLCALCCTALLVVISLCPARADTASDVDTLLRTIRQDQPLPRLAWLVRVESMNAGQGYYKGSWHGIKVAVEQAPNKSNRVYSIQLTIMGRNVTAEILPVVTRHLGRPNHTNPGKSEYFWDFGNYRLANMWYGYIVNRTPGGSGTVLNIGYR